MRIFILLITFLALQSLNCGTNDSGSEFPKLVFRQDLTLLSSPNAFDKLSLSIPMGFEKLSLDKYLSIEKKFETEDDNYFKLDLLSIYQHSDGQVIFISKIVETKPIYQALNNDYELGLIETLNASDTNKGQFLINNNEAVQYITTNDRFVNYRLFYNVKSSNCYLIDYFVPKQTFSNFQLSLETSISTISIKN